MGIKKHGLITHGLTNTPTYTSYHAMKTRCLNPNHTSYEDYGGRGIAVDPRWLGKEGFLKFLEDMGERPEGLTLERKNTNLGYGPDNCKWATPKQQANNRRNTKTQEQKRARLRVWMRVYRIKNKEKVKGISRRHYLKKIRDDPLYWKSKNHNAYKLRKLKNKDVKNEDSHPKN